jgi:ABC-type uncharacterized transport system permease subunit
MTQTPADLFVERLRGADVLAPLFGQLAWALVLLTAAQLATLAATRRVVIQGG